MAGLHPDDKKALLEALLDEDRVARRLTTDAANEPSRVDSALEAALSCSPKWWFPRYGDRSPSRVGWRAYAERRRRFATGIRDVAALTLLIALLLPGYVDRTLFIVFSVTLAAIWAWQFDIANRELAGLTALPEWPSGLPTAGKRDVSDY
jgi:hypothetical protein